MQNSIEAAKCVRARLQSCRKSNKIVLGFSHCGYCFQLFAIPQRLKPETKLAMCGTTKVVPFHKTGTQSSFSASYKAPPIGRSYGTAETVPFQGLDLIDRSFPKQNFSVPLETSGSPEFRFPIAARADPASPEIQRLAAARFPPGWAAQAQQVEAQAAGPW